ncbi:nonribosomal peptide synthetase lcsA [Trichoderma asperellum]|uniref:Nonribosomal peptide synthetase lcsA n=1 Tax=Trichoderma asperellum TaxID=101201 RepID=A0A6V8R2Z8_TRIAP|nr:nonribosomal peptide synthetase lcsA [Trichoderma asperellum]
MEVFLQKLWSELLGVSIESIGCDDSFLGLGGDSITAIHMVSAARESGITLTVKEIFDDPRLSAVASKARAIGKDEKTSSFDASPFCLLDTSTQQLALGDEVRSLCSLTVDEDVEDAYPTTMFQEGLMALSVKQPGSYIAKYAYRLSDDVDIGRFKAAWEQTVALCPTLRTRIVLLDGKCTQIVIKETPSGWHQDHVNVRAASQAIRSAEMTYGSRLSQSALVSDDDGKYYFLWTVHHAVHDGWTVRLVMTTFQNAYHNLEMPPLKPYSAFIHYLTGTNNEDTANYWKQQLQGARKASYPSTVPASAPKGATRQINKTIQVPASADPAITKATIMRATWAILLARYCDTDDITFGTSISGRQAPVSGLMDMPGPVVATVPVRVRLDQKQTISTYLQAIQNQAHEMVPYEQYGLSNIGKISADIKEACDFTSLLVVQPRTHLDSRSKSMSAETEASSSALLLPTCIEGNTVEESMQGYFSYPLVIQGHLFSDFIELFITYDSSAVSEPAMEAMCHQFNHVASQLFESKNLTLGDLTVASDWDLQRVIDFNQEIPEFMDTCVHHLIEARAREAPNSPAICAWDGVMTYGQLNELANILAHHLIAHYSVHVEDLIHVCFEKSVWYWVSVLAINKAGAVWVPLDPSHPEQRIRQVTSQTHSKLALVSDTTRHLVSDIVDQVLEVSPALYERLNSPPGAEDPQVTVSSHNAVYVLFTSGSTGTPKGLVQTHGGVSSTLSAIRIRMGIDSNNRTLQFASYVFDMSIGEGILHLMSGACIFIPSEDTRMNGLTEFINEHQINSLWLTPSFVRTISPEQVPSVDFLLLAGEAVTRDVLTTWCGSVRLFNGWGPAETCVFSSLHEFTSIEESPLTIGRPIGGHCWIVDPANPYKLAPIGTLGEVVIQSPAILREYLDDVERTKASTIYDLPTWAPRRDEPHWSRFFKSGDLALYNPDGTLEFSSRKDTQVKIRGLRVELGEIEYHVRSNLESARQVAVDVFKTDAGIRLVVYLCFSDEIPTTSISQSDENIFLPISEELQRQLADMVSQLSISLPRYMVPSLFVPCRYMPFITSTKLDRNKLKKLISELSQEDYNTYSLSSGSKRMPDTEMERRMQELWSVVLHMPISDIGCDDSFLQIGGDSIAAIQLVTNAREAGISIAVKDIFKDPRLSKLALVATISSGKGPSIITPFSLLEKSITKAHIIDAVKEQCGLTGDDLLDDAYPCTQLQEGLVALAVKQPGSYIAKYLYQLPDHVEVSRFRAAWERTVKSCANLRTRMLLVSDITIQAILRDDIAWDETAGVSLEAYAHATLHLEMGYAQRLCRYAIIQEQSGTYFAFSIHHTVFDGWSLPLVMSTLSAAYYELELPSLQSYSVFVKYTMELDKSAASNYWKTQLRDAKRATFPAPSDKPGASQTRIMNKTIEFHNTNTSITKASILRGAWAIVLARYSDSDDVCFGTTVSGRHANIAGLESMPGLVVATVPVRIRLDKQKTLMGFLQDIQTQASDMVDYEQFGIQNISKLGLDAKEACDFTSLLAIQPVQHMSADSNNPSNQDALIIPSASPNIKAEDMLQNYFSYPLVIQCHLFDDHVNLVLVYDSDILEEAQLGALMHQFDHVVQQLLAQNDEPLVNVSVAGPWDLQQALQLNNKQPEIVQTCLHDLFAEHALRDPTHEAIYSSEGSLTYGELDHLSDILAAYLSSLNVGPETVVPYCFEKSMWAVIAILATLKTGAAFMPLDPSHPIRRRAELVKEVKARVLIASENAAASCAGMAEHIVELSPSVLAKLSASVIPRAFPKVGPRNAAYVLFTSGSTGKPKGVVMEHSALTTSTVGYGRVYSFSPASRVFQFSNYIFDGSLGEILATLAFGGTVCIPNESERLQDAPGFIRKARINTAMLTPSFVRTFTPDQVPNLKTLVLGGEPAGKDILDTWCDRVNLINGYGPAEACNYATWHPFSSSKDSPHIIGKPFNSSCWIVEPDNHHLLTPVGCVGELAIQGHVLARGYINDSERTKASFVTEIYSLSTQAITGPQRFYLTGDLVRYCTDGLLEYLGRKDSQVKLRGQRIELGEIEYNIQRTLPDIEHVAVDIITRESGQSLVAFVSFLGTYDDNGVTSFSDSLIQPSDALRTANATLLDNLKAVLPGFMIPNLVLPIRKMPFITSMKLDRKQLRTLASSLSSEELAIFAPGKADKIEPTTDMEFKIRDLWAQILKISPAEIGKNDSFLQIGGDSISAIHLISLAQEKNILLTVASIFADPRLSAVALSARLGEVKDNYSTEPFSMIPPSERNDIVSEIEKQCNLSDNQSIEDAYPTTKLQAGLMSLAVKQPGSYTARYVYRVPEHVNIERFKAAWNKTVEVCHNLRTSIVLVGYTTIQAVIKGNLESLWEPTAGVSLQSYVQNAIHVFNMGYGTRLCRYALIEDGGSHYFACHMHHSVYDGWTYPLIMGTLYAAYAGTELPPLQPFARFVKYTTTINDNDAAKYWKRQLCDAQRASFPRADQYSATANGEVDITRILQKSIEFPRFTNTSITKATVIRAAWSIVLAQYCDVNDVCFGTTVSGRHAPVPGLETMPGPMFATVPVRVRLDKKQPITRFLQDIQIQASEMVAYEQFGLQNISALSSEARQACDFSSLLSIQPAQRPTTEEKGMDNDGSILLPSECGSSTEESLQNFANYPLVLQIVVMDSQVELLLIYKSSAMTEFQATAISEQFGHVARQLLAQDERLLGEVEVAGSWDLQKQLEWNDKIYGPEDTTLHDMFSKQCTRRPNHEAIYSSEQSMTYAQLDNLTTQLAAYLYGLGIRAGAIVPFCFEKSMWAIVAMFGILKVGGTFMPLDPSHPVSRRQALIDEVGAQFMIVSPTTAPNCQGMVQNTIELSPSLISRISTRNATTQTVINSDPNDAAYILFTSGSTGKPKGVVIDHKAVSAVLLRQGEAYAYNDDTRMLQFANYTFDACIAEIFTSLAVGVTVCVPTEHERLHNTAAFIREARVNHGLLTPTFIKTLSPEQIPGMKSLLTMGEAPSRELIETWAGKIDLHNCYGPAEACVTSTNYTYSPSIKTSATHLGRSFTHGIWIVNADNHNRLVPVGCVGELLLQGSCLARGYINNEEKTRQSFIEDVDWLPSGVNIGERRFYKTGDLVRYTPDGSIEYLGRKDTQVKIRGQRIELGEIEYQIRRANDTMEHAVVDISRNDSHESLIAFICFTSHQETETASNEVSFTELTSELQDTFSDIAAKISSVLPVHMVPKYFIPVDHMPHNASGKLDRKLLLASAANFTTEELSSYLTDQRLPFRDCSTDTEFWIRNQWATALNLPGETISVDDNFYSLGGDSIRIVTISKAIVSQYGVSLGMSLLNSKHTTIANMAEHVENELSGQEGQEIGRVDIMAEISSLNRSIMDTGALELTANPKTELPDQATVFLSGATGFLGQEILRQLVCNNNIASVIALVRCKSIDHGLDRIRTTAKIAGWWSEDYSNKIEIWSGDLSKKRMDLTKAQWARLAGKSTNNIDAIIHNGAIVNWNADYSKMRAANVDSTVDLLKAAVNSPASPKFLFVSGGINTDPTTDRTSIAQYLSNLNGYSQTKFVCEGVIQEVINTLPADQNRISTLKPGRIIGSSETGVANVDDMLWRVVSTAASLHVYPSEPEDNWTSAVAVDTVASSVLDQIYTKEGIKPFVSVHGGVPATVFWDVVNKELEVPCEPIPLDEWIHRALESMNQVGEQHPLWPVQHFLGAISTPRTARDAEVEDSELQQRYLAIRMSMRYLIEIGFIQSSTEGFSQPRRADTFQRIHG